MRQKRTLEVSTQDVCNPVPQRKPRQCGSCDVLRRRGNTQPLAVSRSFRQTEPMNNPWKLIAMALAAALVVLAIFTILVINGVLDFGLSVL